MWYQEEKLETTILNIRSSPLSNFWNMFNSSGHGESIKSRVRRNSSEVISTEK